MAIHIPSVDPAPAASSFSVTTAPVPPGPIPPAQGSAAPAKWSFRPSKRVKREAFS
jgi:hypothetical protein